MNAADDAFHIGWMREPFAAVHAAQGGKPYSDARGRYEALLHPLPGYRHEISGKQSGVCESAMARVP
ncbi:hypothetical protein WS71_13380 [Burkholderia mayonis]|uniref:Uncharacterized protein n=1 Tax=Burkholderia mayonis TaxID=1385591 RepID=A0A1B4FXN7_9BURK|nr:hypothetical protein [Burkholderia mayonis]AOJ08439.1 hypothetical protein WS71_13380 [Burkholderia mayonis]KVE52877.1 hypothetical protein WS71_08855 [Burkholderia mayonis]